jgi:hypothetical protein
MNQTETRQKINILALREAHGTADIQHQISIQNFNRYILATPLDPHHIVSLVRRKELGGVKHEYIILKVERDRNGMETWVRLERTGIMTWWSIISSSGGQPYDSVSCIA